MEREKSHKQVGPQCDPVIQSRDAYVQPVGPSGSTSEVTTVMSPTRQRPKVDMSTMTPRERVISEVQCQANVIGDD